MKDRELRSHGVVSPVQDLPYDMYVRKVRSARTKAVACLFVAVHNVDSGFPPKPLLSSIHIYVRNILIIHSSQVKEYDFFGI